MMSENKNTWMDLLRKNKAVIGIIWVLLSTSLYNNGLIDDTDVDEFNAKVFAAIQDYIDEGLGGSPYKTKKGHTYIFDWLKISGTKYYYFMNGDSGNLEYYSTNGYTAAQEMMNRTTDNAGGAVNYLNNRVKGNASVLFMPGTFPMGAKTLKYPNKITIVGCGEGITTITGTASPIMRNMWANFTYGVIIEKMSIIGAVAKGIQWSVGAATYPAGENFGSAAITLRDLRVRDTTHSLWAKTISGSSANIVMTNYAASGQGIYLERIFDSSFIRFSCGYLELYKGCTANDFDNFYIGGGTTYNLRIWGDTSQWSNYGNEFSGRFDNPLQTWISFEGFAQGNLVSGSILSNINWASADDTYSGIIHGATTHSNSILANRFVNDLEANDAAVLKYVIEEVAGSENNSWIANSYEDNHYSGIELWDRATGRLLHVADPTVSNFENRKEVYEGAISDNFGDVSDRFSVPYGFYFNAATDDYTRELRWWRNGYFANLKVRFSTSPGVGDWRSGGLWWDSATEYLTVTVTEGDTYGWNTSFIEVDANALFGTDFALKYQANAGASTNTRPFWTYEFYPRAEDIIGAEY